MQIYPVLLLTFIYRLPETPRWLISKERDDDAHNALEDIYGEEDADSKLEELKSAYEEEASQTVNYSDMIFPSGSQFHPTMVTVMGQVNQALTGYGAVSVYGPQIFELLGFGVRTSEYLTLGNYVSYFFMMTFAWLTIDVVGRRILMLGGSFGMATCFAILALLGGLAMNTDNLGIPMPAVAVPGAVVLYIATAAFGIGWLSQVWLIPTEIFPSTARAQGSAISVVIWGFANFTVTLLTPIGFNNLKYWLFLVFAATNTFAGWWTWVSHSSSLYRWSSLNVFSRHTLRKLVEGHSRRTNSSSKMRRSILLGVSARSTRASSSTCRRVRRTRVMGSQNHFWAIRHDIVGSSYTFLYPRSTFIVVSRF